VPYDQAATDAQAIAQDNAAAFLVGIHGATGVNAPRINGFFEPTAERRNGRVVYMKRLDDQICIEHRQGAWEVKPVSFKGQATCLAFVKGRCGLEACVKNLWQVNDGKSKWFDAPMIRMAVACRDANLKGSMTVFFEPTRVLDDDEAERKVCSGIHAHAPPHPSSSTHALLLPRWYWLQAAHCCKAVARSYRMPQATAPKSMSSTPK